MTSDLPRRTLLRFLVVFGAPGAVTTGDLQVRLNTEGLRISAPRLRYLQGKTLDRLRDGATVTADLQYSLLVDSRMNLFRRALGRFAISYDLWEEKFAVTQIVPSRRSATHLAMSAAEAWCLENLPVSTEGLAADRDFWLKLELRLDDTRSHPALANDSGISLNGLIDIFSRNARLQQPRVQLEGGPYRLATLRK